MDSIDIGILKDLRDNCRTTYEAMARKYGLSSNAIKKRVARLVNSGVIERFVLALKPAMMDSDGVLALAYGLNYSTELSDIIGSNPIVRRVGFDSYGCCVIVADCIGPEGIAELGAYLRGLEGVSFVEIHTLLIDKGAKVELSKLDLRVLKILKEDPRMRYAHVAEKTGLTSRRVSRIITKLMQENAVSFTIWLDPNAGDYTFFTFRLSWNDRDISAEEIVDLFSKEYRSKFWQAAISVTEPLMWADFLADHIRESEDIAARIADLPSVEIKTTIIPYPAKRYPGLSSKRLEEMFAKAGLT